jgi:hypothetical protein
MPSDPGGRTSRGSRPGTWTTASRASSSPSGGSRRTDRLRLRPASIGNGREASMARGVRAGMTSSR